MSGAPSQFETFDWKPKLRDMFDEDLVKDVVSPLPTTKAVVMMSKSLSAREIVIWKALGDCWQTPRRQYGREVLPYRPIFQDGWSPGYVHIPDDDDDEPLPAPRTKKVSSENSSAPPEDYYRSEKEIKCTVAASLAATPP